MVVGREEKDVILLFLFWVVWLGQGEHECKKTS